MSKAALEVINVAGFKGSGKTTVCQHFEKYFGAAIFRPLDLLNSFSPYPIERPTHLDRVQREMLTVNPNAYIDAILQATGRVCIDGLLVVSQADQLRRELGNDYRTLALDCHAILRARHLYMHPKNGYDECASQDILDMDEALVNEGDIFQTNPQAVMDMCRSNGWQLDTGKPLTSTRLQLNTIAAELDWTRQSR